MDNWHGHGGRLAAAVATYGGAFDEWLDCSTGINPRSWSQEPMPPIEWRRLPDPEAQCALEHAGAAHFGARPGCVRAVPGSEIGLRLIAAATGGAAARVTPGYPGHADAFPAAMEIDGDAIEAAARGGRAILLANPNNPNGRLLGRDRLLALARLARDAGGQVIVDEAFADCDPAHSVAPDAGGELPLTVLRSFGKFFGLAGVRLGFAVASPAMLREIDGRLGSWPVSAAAIAFGTAAYRDGDWIGRTRTSLVRQAAALDAMLARHGLTAIGRCPLFRLVETPDAGGLFARLARARILTRPFAYRRDWLRIGLPGSAEALARLDDALGHG